jgi:hypothetical protein
MTLNVLFYQVVFKKEWPFYVQKESCFCAGYAGVFLVVAVHGVQ